MKKRKQRSKSKHKSIVFHGGLPFRPILLAAGLLGLPQMAAAFPANIDLASLNGTNGFRLAAADLGFLGHSVSNAGDVNGDGIDDLIIGAYASPNGLAFGVSYVVFGGSGVGNSGNLNLANLDGTNGFKISGVAEVEFLGKSVSAAGDVNGDGIDDLIIGAPYADPNGNNSGASYVVFGGKKVGSGGNLELSSLNGTNGFKLSGVAAFDQSGLSVSGAGDVNGDGVDDIIIGAGGVGVGADYGIGGASYVVFGGKRLGRGGNLELSSLDGTNGFELSGLANSGFSGVPVSAGDINGDGIDDLILGAPYDANDNHAGVSYVVFGGRRVGLGGNINVADLNGTNGFKLSGVAAYDSTGRAVSTAGDVNGDGVDDLLIGAYGADPNGDFSGASYVVFGGSGVGSGGNLELSSLDSTNGFKISGAAMAPGAIFGDTAGFSVSNAGDVNGDGVDDIIIGARTASVYGTLFSGASYVVFGQVDTALLCNGKVPTIIGTEGHDVLVGTDGEDVIMGLGGKDIILGHDGRDTICGGDGNDKILAGDGMDWLFGGRGKDLAQGEDNNDVLNGGSGPDVCNGGDGQDRARNCETVIKVP